MSSLSATMAACQHSDVDVGLVQYLTTLYSPEATGEIVACAKQPCFRRRFGQPSDLENLANVIRELDAESDVYLNVNLLDGDSVRSRGQYARGCEREVTSVVALVADVDAEKADNKHKYPMQGKIIKALDAMPIPPTMVVASGKEDGGVHVYWVFPEPFIIKTPADREWIKDISKRWQELLRQKLAPFDLDATFDLVRVLRPVGTINKKYGTLVKCLRFSPESRYSPDTFVPHLPALEKRRVGGDKLAKVKLPVARNLSATKKDKFDQLVLLCDTAEKGQRSETDFAACCWAIEHGMAQQDAWQELQTVGKFAEEEDRYFLRTWEAAEHYARQKLFEQAQASAAKKATPSGEDQPEFHLTDMGNAQRFARRYGHLVRYCWAWSKWLYWDGKRWSKDCEGHVQKLAKKTVLAMYAEAAKLPDHERNSLLEHAQESEKASAIRAMLELAKSEDGIPVLPSDLDSDHMLLNLANGTLDLRTGTLSPHDPQQLITKLCPVAYDPNAECPLWLSTLSDIFLRRQVLLDYVQRFFGYALTGDVTEQILPIFHGKGANGKSTILDVVLDLMGEDYTMKAPADLLMQKPHQTHPTEQADLYGKRLVVCVETDEDRRMAENLVKEWTGGDKIRARRMREDFWQFSPTHKIVLACNHKPAVRGTDHAIWRRLRLVPFERTFGPDEQDKKLGKKLRKEFSGILAWCVRGSLLWQSGGLGMPDEVAAATDVYEREQDTFGYFLSECCVVDKNTKVRGSDIFRKYQDWSGDKHMTQTKFSQQIQNRGFKKVTSNGAWYHGVGLLRNLEGTEGLEGS